METTLQKRAVRIQIQVPQGLKGVESRDFVMQSGTTAPPAWAPRWVRFLNSHTNGRTHREIIANALGPVLEREPSLSGYQQLQEHSQQLVFCELLMGEALAVSSLEARWKERLEVPQLRDRWKSDQESKDWGELIVRDMMARISAKHPIPAEPTVEAVVHGIRMDRVTGEAEFWGRIGRALRWASWISPDRLPSGAGALRATVGGVHGPGLELAGRLVRHFHRCIVSAAPADGSLIESAPQLTGIPRLIDSRVSDNWDQSLRELGVLRSIVAHEAAAQLSERILRWRKDLTGEGVEDWQVDAMRRLLASAPGSSVTYARLAGPAHLGPVFRDRLRRRFGRHLQQIATGRGGGISLPPIERTALALALNQRA